MDTPFIKGIYTLSRLRLQDGIPIQFDNEYDSVLFENYVSFQAQGNLKVDTLYRNLSRIVGFIRWLEANGKDLSKLKDCDVIDYMNLCQNYSKWKPPSKANNAYQVRTFLNWLFENGTISFPGYQVLPRIEPKRKSFIRSYYTSEEISKFMDTFDIGTAKGKEEYLIICLIVYLGLRISDVVYLKLSDIDFHNRIINIIQYKTGQYLSLPLIDELLIPLGDHLMNCRPSDAEIDYLFITGEKPYRLKEELKTHNYIVRKHLALAGIDTTNRKTGFHALRHSCRASQ